MVLDLARWAPSGDNTQPWRFRIDSPTSALIRTFDTRRHCVYDLTGRPSHIAAGALLETARIAASMQHMHAEIARLPTPSEEDLRFRVDLVADPGVRPDPLAACIELRATQRRPFSRRPLKAAEKSCLQASVGSEFRVKWFEGPLRARIARLMFESAKIRLTIPEAYEVHREVIEWGATVSQTGIPDRAIGLDPFGVALMRWAMQSWSRTRVLSTYFGGTLLPRLQLELIPGFRCAAHLLICAASEPEGVDDYLRAGAAVQRFWLTAEMLGLRHQPEMTPLIFASYARQGRRFTVHEPAYLIADSVRAKLLEIAGESAALTAVWMGRVGQAPSATCRSVRLPLTELLESEHG
jgi:hypothetical protein